MKKQLYLALFICFTFILNNCNNKKSQNHSVDTNIDSQINNKNNNQIIIEGNILNFQTFGNYIIEENLETFKVDTLKILNVDSTGYFRTIFELHQPRIVTLLFSNKQRIYNMLLQPNKNMYLQCNLSDMDNSVEFDSSNYVNTLKRKINYQYYPISGNSVMKKIPKLFSRNPEVFLKRVDSIKTFTNNEIHHAESNYRFSDFEKSFLFTHHNLSNYYFKNMYAHGFKQLDLKPTDKYYDFVEKVNFEDKNSLYFPFDCWLEYSRALKVLYLRNNGDLNNEVEFLKFIDSSIIDKRICKYVQCAYVFNSLSGWDKNIRNALTSYIMQTFPNSLSSDAIKKKTRSIDGIKEITLSNLDKDLITDINGETVKLSHFKGKIILIDVWGTGCGPCKKEFPHLYSLLNEFDDNDNFICLSLSFDENIEVWEKFLQNKKKGNNLVELNMKSSFKSNFAKSLFINGIPVYILIGKDGQILYENAPHPSNPELMEIIKNLLKTA